MNRGKREKEQNIKLEPIYSIQYNVLFFCISFTLVGIGPLHQSYFNKTLRSSVSLILDDCTMNIQ